MDPPMSNPFRPFSHDSANSVKPRYRRVSETSAPSTSSLNYDRLSLGQTWQRRTSVDNIMESECPMERLDKLIKSMTNTCNGLDIDANNAYSKGNRNLYNIDESEPHPGNLENLSETESSALNSNICGFKSKIQDSKLSFTRNNQSFSSNNLESNKNQFDEDDYRSVRSTPTYSHISNTQHIAYTDSLNSNPTHYHSISGSDYKRTRKISAPSYYSYALNDNRGSKTVSSGNALPSNSLSRKDDTLISRDYPLQRSDAMTKQRSKESPSYLKLLNDCDIESKTSIGLSPSTLLPAPVTKERAFVLVASSAPHEQGGDSARGLNYSQDSHTFVPEHPSFIATSTPRTVSCGQSTKFNPSISSAFQRVTPSRTPISRGLGRDPKPSISVATQGYGQPRDISTLLHTGVCIDFAHQSIIDDKNCPEDQINKTLKTTESNALNSNYSVDMSNKIITSQSHNKYHMENDHNHKMFRSIQGMDMINMNNYPNTGQNSNYSKLNNDDFSSLSEIDRRISFNNYSDKAKTMSMDMSANKGYAQSLASRKCTEDSKEDFKDSDSVNVTYKFDGYNKATGNVLSSEKENINKNKPVTAMTAPSPTIVKIKDRIDGNIGCPAHRDTSNSKKTDVGHCLPMITPQSQGRDNADEDAWESKVIQMINGQPLRSCLKKGPPKSKVPNDQPLDENLDLGEEDPVIAAIRKKNQLRRRKGKADRVFSGKGRSVLKITLGNKVSFVPINHPAAKSTLTNNSGNNQRKTDMAKGGSQQSVNVLSKPSSLRRSKSDENVVLKSHRERTVDETTSNCSPEASLLIKKNKNAYESRTQSLPSRRKKLSSRKIIRAYSVRELGRRSEDQNQDHGFKSVYRKIESNEGNELQKEFSEKDGIDKNTDVQETIKELYSIEKKDSPGFSQTIGEVENTSTLSLQYQDRTPRSVPDLIPDGIDRSEFGHRYKNLLTDDKQKRENYETDDTNLNGDEKERITYGPFRRSRSFRDVHESKNKNSCPSKLRRHSHWNALNTKPSVDFSKTIQTIDEDDILKSDNLTHNDYADNTENSNDKGKVYTSDCIQKTRYNSFPKDKKSYKDAFVKTNLEPFQNKVQVYLKEENGYATFSNTDDTIQHSITSQENKPFRTGQTLNSDKVVLGFKVRERVMAYDRQRKHSMPNLRGFVYPTPFCKSGSSVNATGVSLQTEFQARFNLTSSITNNIHNDSPNGANMVRSLPRMRPCPILDGNGKAQATIRRKRSLGMLQDLEKDIELLSKGEALTNCNDDKKGGVLKDNTIKTDENPTYALFKPVYSRLTSKISVTLRPREIKYKFAQRNLKRSQSLSYRIVEPEQEQDCYNAVATAIPGDKISNIGSLRSQCPDESSWDDLLKDLQRLALDCKAPKGDDCRTAQNDMMSGIVKGVEELKCMLHDTKETGSTQEHMSKVRILL